MRNKFTTKCFFGIFVLSLCFQYFSKAHDGDNHSDRTASSYDENIGGHGLSNADPETGKYHIGIHTTDRTSTEGHSAPGSRCHALGLPGPLGGSCASDQQQEGDSACVSCFLVYTANQVEVCPTGSGETREVQPLFGNISISEPTASNTEKVTTIQASPIGGGTTKNYEVRWWCGKIRELPVRRPPLGEHWYGRIHERGYTYSDDGPPGAAWDGDGVRMCSLLIPKSLRDDNTAVLPRNRFSGDQCNTGNDYFNIWVTCPKGSGSDKERACKDAIRNFIEGRKTLQPGIEITKRKNCCPGVNNCKRWITGSDGARCWAPLFDRAANTLIGNRDAGKGKANTSTPFTNINVLSKNWEDLVLPGGVLQNMQCLSNGMQTVRKCTCSSGYKFNFSDKDNESCFCPDGTPKPANGVCQSCPAGTTENGGFCECNNGSYKFAIEATGDARKCTCPDNSVKPANGVCLVCTDNDCRVCPLTEAHTGCFTGASKIDDTLTAGEVVWKCPAGSKREGQECLTKCVSDPNSVVKKGCAVKERIQGDSSLPALVPSVVEINLGERYVNNGAETCFMRTRCDNNPREPCDSISFCTGGMGDGCGRQVVLDQTGIGSFPDTPTTFPDRENHCDSGKVCGIPTGVLYTVSCDCPTGQTAVSREDDHGNDIKYCLSDAASETVLNSRTVSKCQCSNSNNYTYDHGLSLPNTDTRCKCPDGRPRNTDGSCPCPYHEHGIDESLDINGTCPNCCRKRCPVTGEIKCIDEPCPCYCPNRSACGGPAPIPPAVKTPETHCCPNGRPTDSSGNCQAPPPPPSSSNTKIGDPNRADIVMSSSNIGSDFRTVYSIGRMDQPDYICWQCNASSDQDCAGARETSPNTYREWQRRDLFCPMIETCSGDVEGRCQCLDPSSGEGGVLNNTYCEYANKDPLRRMNVSGESSKHRPQIELMKTIKVIPPQ